MNSDQHLLPKVAAGLASRRHRRAMLRMIRHAVRDGWEIDPCKRNELCQLAIETRKQASQEKDHRAVIAGCYVFMEFANHNLRVAVAMDRLERELRQAEEQQRRENMVFGKIEFGGGRNDPPNGSHTSMEPIRIPSST